MLFNTGGGNSQLDFRVVGKASAPENPLKNTIWVNTTMQIKSFQFSPIVPDNPVDGMVWFLTGISGPNKIPIVKKDRVYVYPLAVKQYVSGNWQKASAQIYTGSEWKALWSGELYISGNEYEDATGGWITEGLAYNETFVEGAEAEVSKDASQVVVSQTELKGSVYRPKKKIDLTGFSKLRFEGNISQGVGGSPEFARLCVWNRFGSYVNDYIAAQYKGNCSSCEIDVSMLNGEYYIGFFVFYGGSVTKKTLHLE